MTSQSLQWFPDFLERHARRLGFRIPEFGTDDWEVTFEGWMGWLDELNVQDYEAEEASRRMQRDGPTKGYGRPTGRWFLDHLPVFQRYIREARPAPVAKPEPATPRVDPKARSEELANMEAAKEAWAKLTDEQRAEALARVKSAHPEIAGLENVVRSIALCQLAEGAA